MDFSRFFLSFLFLIALLSGCGTKRPAVPNVSEKIDPFLLQAPEPLSALQQKKVYAEYLSHYYAPWQMRELNATFEEATWPIAYYASKAIYAENLLPLKKELFNRWVDNANYRAFNTLKKHAVVVHPTSLRLFPTHRPIFYDPKKPGEGYPFDYNQNSAVKAMTPIIVSHLSSDGGWAFVQTPFALGWLPLRDIAFLEETETERLMELPKVVLLKDRAPVYDANQTFLFYAKMGTLFPKTGIEPSFFRIVVPGGCNGASRLQNSLFPEAWSQPMPIPMERKNIRRVASELLGEPYGWGGMVGNRDCSAMTRDFFAPFGIWLPRNSKAQAQVGRRIDLSRLTAQEKERAIVEKGVPFRTLLYLPGHIMIYVGHRGERAYAMHNMWGIRTKENGRHIIGKAVVTDLYVGENLPEADKKSLLIEKIQSMNIVVGH